MIYKQHSPVTTLDTSDLAPWLSFEIHKFEYDYVGQLCDVVYIDEFIAVLGSFEISSYFKNGDRISRVVSEPKSAQEDLEAHKEYLNQMIQARKLYDSHKYDYLEKEQELEDKLSHLSPIDFTLEV